MFYLECLKDYFTFSICVKKGRDLEKEDLI